MSTVSNLIFGGKEHRMSSPFGKRAVMQTSAGKTSSFHSGVDYSTGGKKLTQYAIAEGTVESCGKASDGANFVLVNYPSLKVRMLHYHLDSIKVTKGQKVTKGTALGTTGKTGKATGIHLHLGVKRIGSNDWIDAEAWSNDEYPALVGDNLYITTANLNCRKGNSLKYGIVKVYPKGTKITISEKKDNWGKTKDGWVCLDYVKRA